ncbi:O-antigen ligase family protein [Oceanicella actignis]|uniref:O-antigen ligase-related domain-containing protein n=1 Tax=Oceanicella actignis TaxID=1189325 RepID=A0A1M7SWQ8_9RHOB|nr:O-antigen ligase family protein [Oceanicella actignis]TYO90571.1 hypothetical protein LY05_00702 [Oceanicella actignis]SES74310.1 hypothetical protein SAMN04488119_101342 [Oceanicella actignis]SHN62955.1 hypothetical protein SAMN05216200_103344 [Oceanicella actignis]
MSGARATWPAPETRARALSEGTAALLMTMATLGAIKNPAELPLYLRALAPLAGLGFLAATGRLLTLAAPIYAMLCLGVLGTLAVNPDPLALVKIAQIFLMVALAHFVSTRPPHELTNMAARILLPVALIAIPLEIAVGEPESVRSLGGLTLPRFMGLAGYHTHSAGLYFFLAILFLAHRRPWPALFFALATLTTGSRGFAMAGLAALAVHLAPGARLKFASAAALLGAAATTPLWIWALDQALSPQARAWLTLATTKRYEHWLTYINMGLKNPLLGVGYGAGPEAYDRYHVATLSFFEREQQAHNLYISTFGEWGPPAWALLTLFLAIVLLKVARYAPRHLPVPVYVTTLYTLHDGITEWVFWVGVGVALAHANLERARRRFAPGAAP